MRTSLWKRSRERWWSGPESGRNLRAAGCVLRGGGGGGGAIGPGRLRRWLFGIERGRPWRLFRIAGRAQRAGAKGWGLGLCFGQAGGLSYLIVVGAPVLR